MDRKEFLQSSCKYGVCAGTLIAQSLGIAPVTAQETTEDIATVKAEKEFTEHWLSDLMETMSEVLDRETQVKLIEGCGRACFNRHQFKKDIAIKGAGDIDKLIEAYKKNFGIERVGNEVHIRYGGGFCYCPAAKNRPALPDDVHCECTRMTHQTIFETAMGRPFKAEIIESVRRGNDNCHIIIHLT